MLNDTYIKNQGSSQTLIRKNNKHYLSQSQWKADYDGDVANVSLDNTENGIHRHYQFSLDNDDLANLLNVETVHAPLHKRLEIDFSKRPVPAREMPIIMIDNPPQPISSLPSLTHEPMSMQMPAAPLSMSMPSPLPSLQPLPMHVSEAEAEAESAPMPMPMPVSMPSPMENMEKMMSNVKENVMPIQHLEQSPIPQIFGIASPKSNEEFIIPISQSQQSKKRRNQSRKGKEHKVYRIKHRRPHTIKKRHMRTKKK